MTPSTQARSITLRQAAVTSGVGLLVMAVTSPFAEFHVLPKLVVASADETSRNILENQGLFVAGIVAYLVNFIADVVVAWSLYVLFKPVSAALSLLTAWFRLIYTAVAVAALLNLVTALRLLSAPEYLTQLGPDALHAHVKLLVSSFHWGWQISLVLFGIHLVLLGWLVFRSTYVPRVLGVLLAIAGAGYVVYELGRSFFPGTNLEFLFVTFFGEAVFMFWLLIRGWKIVDATDGR